MYLVPQGRIPSASPLHFAKHPSLVGTGRHTRMCRPPPKVRIPPALWLSFFLVSVLRWKRTAQPEMFHVLYVYLRSCDSIFAWILTSKQRERLYLQRRVGMWYGMVHTALGVLFMAILSSPPGHEVGPNRGRSFWFLLSADTFARSCARPWWCNRRYVCMCLYVATIQGVMCACSKIINR